MWSVTMWIVTMWTVKMWSVIMRGVDVGAASRVVAPVVLPQSRTDEA